ncbi:MAG: linear amide C-N hydrolase [Chlamydiales bacterium]|nr:linear amide C-N hydrolase [Chlamydiales bacterium]
MCTRILWNKYNSVISCGRTMDWPESTEPKIVIFPRGIKRDGGRVATELVVQENSLRWTAKYGSVAVLAYGVGTVDGMNEKGLGGNLLYLTSTDYGRRDRKKSGVQVMLWLQYLLDCAASVKEALQLMENVQPVMVEYNGYKSSVHLTLEDKSGDSAIIEYLEGRPKVYHGRAYCVMTNDPPYDQQLNHLQSFDFTAATRETSLPGNVDPVSRFVRSNYFLQTQRKPKNDREAIAAILSIVRNASVPFNAPYKTPDTIYNTEYRTVLDLTNLRYFFELTTSPNLIWIELTKFDLSSGSPVLVLDPDNISLSGDISDKFEVNGPQNIII